MENETVTPETVETPITTEQAVTTENAEPSTETVETKPERTFTQKELDEIITKRLDRERESTAKKAKQEARDAYIAEQRLVDWQGNPVTTEAQYNQALREQEQREQYQKDSEAAIEKLLKIERDQEEIKSKLSDYESKDEMRKRYDEFLETFPDTDPKDIPQTVWDEVDKGKSLVDAYARHENQTLRQQLAELQQAKQIEQQNQANAASSTGSVTGNGTSTPAFFTQDQVRAMSVDEVNKNWKSINESMKKW